MTKANAPQTGWLRHFLVRRESYRTTWKLRLALPVVLALGILLTRGVWTRAIARTLTCAEEVQPSDALLVENFDPDYLLFERATRLQRAGIAPRVLVPVQMSRDPNYAASVSKGVADVMARIAHLSNMEVIPIRETEPISLNAALQIRDFMNREGIKSVEVISPGFRSRRSELVYSTVLEPAGITVRCVPVFGIRPPDQFAESWHGIQEAVLQLGKLLYYRFYIFL